MTTDTKINGRVKFYNKEKGFGFITTEDKKEFYFNSSDLSEHYIPRMGDLISFAPNEENLKKSQKPRATFICPRAKNEATSDKKKNNFVECPHCKRNIIPRWIIYQGSKDSSFCPLCGKNIEILETSSGGIVSLILALFSVVIFLIMLFYFFSLFVRIFCR